MGRESLAKIPKLPILRQVLPWLRSFLVPIDFSDPGYSGPVRGRCVRVCAVFIKKREGEIDFKITLFYLKWRRKPAVWLWPWLVPFGSGVEEDDEVLLGEPPPFAFWFGVVMRRCSWRLSFDGVTFFYFRFFLMAKLTFLLKFFYKVSF